jgi:hypothetical protein
MRILFTKNATKKAKCSVDKERFGYRVMESIYRILHAKPVLNQHVKGGERGIRTLGTVARTTVFETVPFDRSGISPGNGENKRSQQ